MDALVSSEISSAGERYMPYVRALAELRRRFGATPDDLAGWVYFGPKYGGLAAYLNADELDSPPQFHYDFMVQGPAFDYLAPLMACWFRESDIARFEPEERFLTGKELEERWEQYREIRVWPYIGAKIAESRLLPFHPIYGGTRCLFPSEPYFPPDEAGLFLLSEVEALEDSELRFAASKSSESFAASDNSNAVNENAELDAAALRTIKRIDAQDETSGKKVSDNAVHTDIEVGSAEIGSSEWRAAVARKGAETVHSRVGGSREKKAILLSRWASGHYATKERCAEEESRALGIAFSTALRYLRNAPKPTG